MKGIEQVVEKEKVGVSTKSSIGASYDGCSAQTSSRLSQLWKPGSRDIQLTEGRPTLGTCYRATLFKGLRSGPGEKSLLSPVDHCRYEPWRYSI